MIDLHMHTSHSDGADSLEELLTKANNKKIDMISITDHDSVGAYFELEKNPELRNKYNGKIIVGIESKTFYDKVPIEILGYGIDYNKIKINQIDIFKIQKETIQKYKKIGKQLGFTFDEKLDVDETDSSKKWASFTWANEILKYEENKKILFEMGTECDAATFYRVHACNKNSIFYSDETMYYIDIDETIKRIHDAGGLAFIAHPLLYPFDDKIKTIEEILEKTEVDGLEVEYPLFSREERERLLEIAHKYNKFVSGGTDYHGVNKPNIDIGSGIKNNISIKQDCINDWKDKINNII